MAPLQRNKLSPDNIKLYQSLGTLIKDYRQWRKLNQETLAESINVSVRELQNWEADRRRVSVENLNDFSEVTGIPMQVCIALNAGQPLLYSLQKRRFAYSSIEVEQLRFSDILKCREKSDGEILAKHDQITTDKHTSTILSCHRDIYGTERPLRRDIIKKAAAILPELNSIVIDCWGHHIGHRVCLPINKDVYKLIRKEQNYEAYLTTESISDIITLKEGVFFYYSSYAANVSAGYRLLIEGIRYFSKIEKKERYLIAVNIATKEEKEAFANLGMRVAGDTIIDEHKSAEFAPTLYEIELDVRMKPFEPLGALEWMIDRSLNADSLTGGADSLTVGNMPVKVCPNPKCDLYCKTGKGNVISNGTYKIKDGTSSRRFLCKKCGKTFCNSAGSIFYGLRSSEDKVITAIKLLAKGLSIRGAAKTLEVRLNTVRHWLKIAAEQSEKIDALLINDPNVTKTELDILWAFVKNNSLRRRANSCRRRE